MEAVTVIGGGLAGCEAAWQLARRGVPVTLCEMKPARYSAAHRSAGLAELVCSNSLRSDQPTSAIGLLHEELRQLDSLVLEAADQHRVPAGRALAVDRELFSAHVTERIESCAGISLVREEVTSLPHGPVVLATGPLTSSALAAELEEVCGEPLYFYDSIAPTVYLDSLDTTRMFRASRYDDGEGDYLNIPLDADAYYGLVDAIAKGDKTPLHSFEEPHYFEGCLPVEVMAERGRDTLAYGPLKPVGLRDPVTGRRPHAVVQLRQEDKQGTLYNLVGFQTKLRQGEQKRIFRTLPGMENAVFARYGSVHRNTFLRSPELLDPHLEHRRRPGLYVTGQVAGVEGYVESTALGLLVGIHVAYRSRGARAPLPPEATALAALLRHLRGGHGAFQPSNVNYGLFPPLPGERRRVPKRERNARMAERALAALAPYRDQVAAGREIAA